MYVPFSGLSPFDSDTAPPAANETVSLPSNVSEHLVKSGVPPTVGPGSAVQRPIFMTVIPYTDGVPAQLPTEVPHVPSLAYPEAAGQGVMV